MRMECKNVRILIAIRIPRSRYAIDMQMSDEFILSIMNMNKRLFFRINQYLPKTNG